MHDQRNVHGSVSILVAGATGLVGGACMRRLLDDPAFDRIVVPTRRPLPRELKNAAGGGRIEERLVDFERLGSDEYDALFDVDQILCCLGTTIKKAGSREQFWEVDFEYAKTLAERGASHGARHFLLVSALGANPQSRIFYNRVKGELEQVVSELPFRSLTIARPSLLLGDRDEFRLGEEIAKRLTFLIPQKYKPVHADELAAVLVEAAREDRAGKRVIESAEIRRIAATGK